MTFSTCNIYSKLYQHTFLYGLYCLCWSVTSHMFWRQKLDPGVRLLLHGYYNPLKCYVA